MFSPRILIATKAQRLAWAFVVFFTVGMHSAQAEEPRSYSYDSIEYTMQVNTDTSVRVEETQSYRFVGEYHQGWRSLPKKGFDDLTDVTVREGVASTPLEYSSRRLNKTDPASWGKYTTFTENGQYIIEWYYNARDTTKVWTLGYTLRGALAFYTDHDEFYWNLFTDFDVPIGSVDATVLLPEASADHLLRESLYVEGVRGAYGSRHDARSFHFFANDITPHAKVTIAPGWPKGMIREPSFGHKLLAFIWKNPFVCLPIVVFVIMFTLWWRFGRDPKGKGVVVPEYSIPESLSPLEMVGLMEGGVTGKHMASAIIDLAVKGYIRIEKQLKPGLLFDSEDYIMYALEQQPPEGSIEALVLHSLFQAGKPQDDTINTQSVSSVLVNIARKLSQKQVLEDLAATQTIGQSVSLRSLKNKFYTYTPVINQEVMRALKVKQYSDDLAWDLQKRKSLMVLVLLILLTFGLGTLSDFIAVNVWTVAALGLSFGIYFFFAAIMPRVTRDGALVKERINGLKEYLQIAEKNRLEFHNAPERNPRLFEQLLPVAMALGVAHIWAKEFAGIGMQPPDWYSGSSSSAFSAGSFVSDLNGFSDRATSLLSSAPGGASGGGGSAGGGGGGGGGGAS